MQDALTRFAEFLADKPLWLSLHLLAGVIAFGVGTAILALPKGGRRHRILGRVFMGAILVTAVSGFFIFEIYGGLSPFHALSAFTMITVYGGFRAIRRSTAAQRRLRRGPAIAAHFSRMSWCLAALIIAAVAEMLRLVPGIPGEAAIFGLTGRPLILALIATTIAVCGGLIGLGALFLRRPPSRSELLPGRRAADSGHSMGQDPDMPASI